VMALRECNHLGRTIQPYDFSSWQHCCDLGCHLAIAAPDIQQAFITAP